MDNKRISDKRTSSKISNTKPVPKKIKKKSMNKNVRSKKTNNITRTNVIKYEDVKSKYSSNGVSKGKTKKILKKKTSKFLVFFFTFVMLVVIFLLLRFLPFFDVESISIEGSARYSTDDISNSAGIYIGQNVFVSFFKTKLVDSNVLPYVKKLTVSLGLPNKVIINVEERIPKYFAFDKENSRFFRLDEDGYILEQASIDDKAKDEILVYDVTFDDEIQLGSKIADIYLEKIKVYEDIKNEMSTSGITTNITKVSFENSLTTITLDDKLRVIFPNDTKLKYKVSFLVSILEKLNEDVVGVIDMTKENPTFSSF